MFKEVIPSCQFSNVTPRYIELMYEENEGKENQEIEKILYKYVMNNKVKQLFITKKEKIPNSLNIEIQEIYDVLKKDNMINRVDIVNDTFINHMYQQYISDDDDDDEERRINKEIKEKYKKYKKVAKYTDENTNDKFAYFMGDKQGAKIFTFHKRLNEWSWIDENVYKQQFKIYKKQIKNKDIIIDIENNNEHTLNGKIWYSLCIQRWDKEANDYAEMTLCKGSIEVFGYMISGYVYYFQNKKDRDNAFKWLVA